MDRLISADALKKALRKCQIESLIAHNEEKNVFDIINEQPTAYDAEKVLTELEVRKSYLSYNGIRVGVPVVTLENALDIVKRGGVECLKEQS